MVTTSLPSPLPRSSRVCQPGVPVALAASPAAPWPAAPCPAVATASRPASAEAGAPAWLPPATLPAADPVDEAALPAAMLPALALGCAFSAGPLPAAVGCALSLAGGLPMLAVVPPPAAVAAGVPGVPLAAGAAAALFADSLAGLAPHALNASRHNHNHDAEDVRCMAFSRTDVCSTRAKAEGRHKHLAAN